MPQATTCMLSMGMLLTAYVGVHAQHASDTLYYSGVDKNGSVNTIYIERDRTSGRYQNIPIITFDSFDSSAYSEGLNYIADSNVAIKKHVLKDVPRAWTYLVPYRDSFYVYKPCNYLWTNMVSISDSVYINQTGADLLVYAITTYQRHNRKTFSFELFGGYQAASSVTIHIIDAKRGIAIFEEKRGETIDYFPMIDVSKMCRMPLMVNDCVGDMPEEYNFPDVDFSQFIPRKYRR